MYDYDRGPQPEFCLGCGEELRKGQDLVCDADECRAVVAQIFDPPSEKEAPMEELQEVTRLDVCAEAMEFTDPLLVNEAAHSAGQIWLEAREAAADKETRRKEYQLQIRDEYVEQGANKTTAEDKVRTDPRYLAYVDECKRLDRERDGAEVLYKCLYQRAWLLARGGVLAEV